MFFNLSFPQSGALIALKNCSCSSCSCTILLSSTLKSVHQLIKFSIPSQNLDHSLFLFIKAETFLMYHLLNILLWTGCGAHHEPPSKHYCEWGTRQRSRIETHRHIGTVLSQPGYLKLVIPDPHIKTQIEERESIKPKEKEDICNDPIDSWCLWMLHEHNISNYFKLSNTLKNILQSQND